MPETNAPTARGHSDNRWCNVDCGRCTREQVRRANRYWTQTVRTLMVQRPRASR